MPENFDIVTLTRVDGKVIYTQVAPPPPHPSIPRACPRPAPAPAEPHSQPGAGGSSCADGPSPPPHRSCRRRSRRSSSTSLRPSPPRPTREMERALCSRRAKLRHTRRFFLEAAPWRVWREQLRACVLARSLGAVGPIKINRSSSSNTSPTCARRLACCARGAVAALWSVPTAPELGGRPRPTYTPTTLNLTQHNDAHNRPQPHKGH